VSTSLSDLERRGTRSPIFSRCCLTKNDHICWGNRIWGRAFFYGISRPITWDQKFFATPTYDNTVLLERTPSSRQHVGRGVFVWVMNYEPHLNEWIHSAPRNFWTSTCAHRAWETATKFYVVIKVNERKILHISSMPPALLKTSVVRMLMRDLYAAATLVCCYLHMVLHICT